MASWKPDMHVILLTDNAELKMLPRENWEFYISLLFEQDGSSSRTERKRESEKDRPFRLRVQLSEFP